MSSAESGRMLRTGEVLIKAGLVTPKQIDEGMALQAETGLRLGDALVLKGHIKRGDFGQCMRDHVVVPVLHAYLDEISSGNYSGALASGIAINRLEMCSQKTENLLVTTKRTNEKIIVQGQAIVTANGSQSLPFGFEINMESGLVTVDHLDIGGLKMWLHRMAGKS